MWLFFTIIINAGIFKMTEFSVDIIYRLDNTYFSKIPLWLAILLLYKFKKHKIWQINF